MELSERHRLLLAKRSRRLGMHDPAQLDSLLEATEKGETDAVQKFISLVTTKFSGFFRHPRHFDIAADHALRVAHLNGRVRLWSAAAATGEEPYSLAIVLIEKFGRSDPPVSILATDVDASALMTAERGEYGERALGVLEPGRRERFFAPTSVKGRWQIGPAALDLVTFQTVSLTNVDWELEGPFEVVFCRNLLMYLEACHRYSIIEHMASLLAPDAVLLLDPAEHLGKAGRWFSPGKEGVHLRRRTGTSVKEPSPVPTLGGRRS